VQSANHRHPKNGGCPSAKDWRVAGGGQKTSCPLHRRWPYGGWQSVMPALTCKLHRHGPSRVCADPPMFRGRSPRESWSARQAYAANQGRAMKAPQRARMAHPRYTEDAVSPAIFPGPNPVNSQLFDAKQALPRAHATPSSKLVAFGMTNEWAIPAICLDLNSATSPRPQGGPSA